MKKHLAAAIVTLISALSGVPVWSADTASDASQVKLQAASIPSLREAIASAAGYAVKSIELKHTAHQLTATVINSKQNSAQSADRETEAVAMASAMEAAMAGKPEFAGVAALHIDYVSRAGKKVKTIQIFDFFRSPANAFVLHKT